MLVVEEEEYILALILVVLEVIVQVELELQRVEETAVYLLVLLALPAVIILVAEVVALVGPLLVV